MATHELEALLAGLGLTWYLEEFQREMIDDACLDSLEPEDMRALGLPIGPRRKLEGRCIKKEAIVKHAGDFGLVAMENGYDGTFTLFACPTVVEAAPATRYLEPPPLAVVLRTDATAKSGSTLARLAALRAADVLTDAEFTRLARNEPSPPPPHAAPTHLPGFASARIQTPFDAGVLREQSSADARAEAGLG
jgi:hypothetical protein